MMRGFRAVLSPKLNRKQLYREMQNSECQYYDQVEGEDCDIEKKMEEGRRPICPKYRRGGDDAKIWFKYSDVFSLKDLDGPVPAFPHVAIQNDNHVSSMLRLDQPSHDVEAVSIWPQINKTLMS